MLPFFPFLLISWWADLVEKRGVSIDLLPSVCFSYFSCGFVCRLKEFFTFLDFHLHALQFSGWIDSTRSFMLSFWRRLASRWPIRRRERVSCSAPPSSSPFYESCHLDPTVSAWSFWWFSYICSLNFSLSLVLLVWFLAWIYWCPFSPLSFSMFVMTCIGHWWESLFQPQQLAQAQATRGMREAVLMDGFFGSSSGPNHVLGLCSNFFCFVYRPLKYWFTCSISRSWACFAFNGTYFRQKRNFFVYILTYL